MTGLIKGALIVVCGIVPAGTLFFMFNASTSEEADISTAFSGAIGEEQQADIAEFPEISDSEIQSAKVLAGVVLVDEFSSIQAIRQRDTLVNVSMLDAMERTGLSREQISTSLVNNMPVEGYLFEFDHVNAAITILMPPDTSIYPSMEEAIVLTGLPKELIILSITEQKTVEGTKFEYAK